MRLTRPLSLVVALSLTAACGPRIHPLGSVPEDNESVTDVPALRHVASVLRSSSLQVKDLFNKRNLKFTGAPNPTTLLKDFETENNTRAHDGTLLSVLTYNVALLKAEPFGIHYAVSPNLDLRLPVLPAQVMSAGFDIICLQEVWHDFSLQKFKDEAPARGYRLFAQDRSKYTDGLVILVKESILADGDNPSVENVPYESQDPKEFWPGPSVKRGYLHVRINHRTLGAMDIFDTHSRAFPENWMARMEQGRQLGLAVKDAAGSDGLAFVTGDMNAGPYYREDTWTSPDGKEHKDWFSNALSWALTMHYGGLDDLFAMGTEAQDVYQGNTVVNHWRDATSTPGSLPGWCARTPNVVLTATDCNALYFQQYAGTEYPARLDHVMAHDPGKRLRVVGSGLEFTERLNWGNQGSFELSDHYGVGISMVVRN